MTIANELLKAEQKINRLNLALAKEAVKQRKKDTRNKIQLGGLAILAGVDKLDKACILGALVKLSTASTEEMSEMFEIGLKKFMEKK